MATTRKDRLAMVGGPVAAVIVASLMLANGLPFPMAWTAGVTVICATWWILEPIPIAATALLPLALMPLGGALTPREVGAAYGSPLILLFLGGFMLSTAMAKSGAHRRIALNMVGMFGGRAGRPLIFGFMLAGAFLSMWVSNVAVALMLLPIALAITDNLENDRIRVVLLLGITYACSIGGIGTPVGTPPNLIFMEVYGNTFGETPSFAEWMGWAMPVVVILLPIAAVWITRGLSRGEEVHLPDPGVLRAEETRTIAVFAVTALLWMTRKEPFGGWSGLLDLEYANDASVALLAAVSCFLIPNGRGGRLLDWDTAVKLPWGILVLFGGGVCIASAFISTGLSELVGNAMAGLGTLPTIVLVGGICLTVTFMTEITSNTATTALLMPILAAAAIGLGVDARLIMVPAVISASCAFMLPIATGPNAVVFGSGYLKVIQMAREGLVLNFIGAFVIALVCTWLFSA